jgi:hypothetical protein
MTSWKVLVVLAAALAVSTLAYPKGIFQAEGKIDRLERRGDAITFRFVGKIFPADMIPAERNLMQEHVAYWTRLMKQRGLIAVR